MFGALRAVRLVRCYSYRSRQSSAIGANLRTFEDIKRHGLISFQFPQILSYQHKCIFKPKIGQNYMLLQATEISIQFNLRSKFLLKIYYSKVSLVGRVLKNLKVLSHEKYFTVV